MPRAKSATRLQAYDMYKQSGGDMLCKDIAAALGVSDSQIRNWKAKDKWDDQLKKNTVAQSNDTVAQSKPDRDPKTGRMLPGNKAAVGHGAPEGNQNAKGNKGGPGAPIGNRLAEKHGFFSRIFPDDEETREILAEIQDKSPLDILWDQIQIQYLAIARAQKIMWVTGKEEMIKELKRSYEKQSGRTTEKTSSSSEECEYEYEFQFAWDRHATFLKAQSRAIQTLNQTIERYEKMLLKDLATEEQQLRIDKLKAEIAKITDGGMEGQTDDDGFLEALQGKVDEVWADEET